jgi:hypothetical protein
MIVTKRALPRRTFLRGAGATLALPLLDAMVPAMVRAAAPALRLGFFYAPNGMQMVNVIPKAEGTSFDMPPTLQSLAHVRERLVIVTQLANSEADPRELGAGPHARANAAWLNGVRPKHTEGADVEAGKTIDQYAADALGASTPLRSLELALEPNFLVGNCESGYSCVYQNTISWRTPTSPLVMENNPRAVFERLFGDASTPGERAERLRRRRSILDSVSDEVAGLQRTLGAADRGTVTEYLDSVRDVERRLERAERQHTESPVDLQRPAGIPASFHDHATLMFDLQFLAYRSDITRVVAFQIGREQSQRSYPWIGVYEAHHEVSHHQNDPERMAKNGIINAYHVSLFNHLVERMRDAPDGDGSLLDHSLLLYGSGMSDGDAHSVHNLPAVLVGGANGQLRGGRHLRAAVDTPVMNLGVSVLHMAGVRLDRVGDSTGPLAGL